MWRAPGQALPGRPGGCRFASPGLVGYWRFDEGAGQTFHVGIAFDNRGRLGSTDGEDAQDPTWAISDAPSDCKVAAEAPLRRGDVNRDGELNLADPLTILSHLFQGGVDLQCLDAADSNVDGDIDLAGAPGELGYLFLGQVDVIAAPFPGCGKDVSPDAVDCKAYGACN